MNDPVAAWRALQAEVPDSAAWVESVMSAQQDAGFVYHGKAMLEVAEPTFVTASQVAADQRAAEAVVAALVAAGRLPRRPRPAEHLHPGLARRCSRRRPVLVAVGLLAADRVRASGRGAHVRGSALPGVQRGLPGGILPADRSADLLADTDLARAFGQQHPSAPQPSARTCWMR